MENSLSTLNEISHYCLTHSEANLIVDTSALVLFIVGIYDPDYVDCCPLMTENDKFYKKKDFELIEEILKRFPNKIIITPHVLAEVNMLSKKISPDRRSAYFTKLIQELEKHKEHCVELKVLLKNGVVIQFGFTDVSLIEAAEKNKWAVLTDDFKLWQAFHEKVAIINFSRVATAEQLAN